jgi:hypothetical protein
MKRPRLSIRVYAIRSEQTKIMNTYGGAGDVSVERMEWGIGKGIWKRDVRKAAKLLHLQGQVRVTYFLVGSRYTLKYTGSKNNIEAFHNAI